MQNPATRKEVKPAGLGAPPPQLSIEQDPREVLVDWMVAKDNPFFAKALASEISVTRAPMSS